VIQYNEYYPFGLQANSSWTRDNNKNNYLYNEGSELNTNSGWYEMTYRGYDPAIGRMNQADPMAAKYHDYSSYNYALNNPVMMNDPNGADARSEMHERASAQADAMNYIGDFLNNYAGASRGGGGKSGGGPYWWGDWDDNVPSAEAYQLKHDLKAIGVDSHVNTNSSVTIDQQYGYTEWDYHFDEQGNYVRSPTAVIGVKKIKVQTQGGPGDPWYKQAWNAYSDKWEEMGRDARNWLNSLRNAANGSGVVLYREKGTPGDDTHVRKAPIKGFEKVDDLLLPTIRGDAPGKFMEHFWSGWEMGSFITPKVIDALGKDGQLAPVNYLKIDTMSDYKYYNWYNVTQPNGVDTLIYAPVKK
jgi:RHS repeat-associated protein